MIRKAVFLTNLSSLSSSITGGVQLCSQEFLEILNSVENVSIVQYHVTFTKNIWQRILIKIGFENYSMYDIDKDKGKLITFIQNNGIDLIFINMASLVRYAKAIKDVFGNKVKIILLSHGNNSGDFLHLLSKPLKPVNKIRLFINKIRLGHLIATESMFRVKYLDAVITLSETEMQIENWFGAKSALFLPRRLAPAFLKHQPIAGRIGFVGRLDHPPNFQGLSILLDSFTGFENIAMEFRLVGAPENYGKKLAKEFKNVKYLGELSDEELEKEVSSWALLLNPVWWYSTGASTKLAKAISWGIPIVTTTAGMRGYRWTKGKLLLADTPQQMGKTLIENSFDLQVIKLNAAETKIVANSGFTVKELAEMVKQLIA